MKRLKEAFINNYDVGSTHWVDVTHIEHPEHFYVRPIVYREFLCLVNKFGPRFPLSELNVGSITVFKSKLMKCYARGRVMFIQFEDEVPSCDLFAPDYGCYERCVPLKRIRKPLNSANVPPLAIFCLLADCKPHKLPWSVKAIERMKYFIGNEEAKIVIRGKGPDSLIVELLNSCPEDIATMLVSSGFADLGYGNNMINRYTKITPERHYYIYKNLEVGEKLTVRAQSGDSLKHFYVADTNDYQHYLNEIEKFTSVLKNQPSILPDELKVGMFVGVWSIATSRYERAQVTQILLPSGRAMVRLVDWGKTVQVPFYRLKAMSGQFFLMPAVAIFCCSIDSQLWDNMLHRFLHPGFEFVISVEKPGVNFDKPNIVRMEPKE